MNFNNRLQLSIDDAHLISILKHMKRLSIIFALLTVACQQEKQSGDTASVELVDHKSTRLTVTIILNRDVNHIGKSTLNKILDDELFKVQDRINSRLSKSGLPTGTMKIEKK